MTERKPYQWLAWLGTALIILGASLAAFNVFPAYIFVFIVGNGVWALAGWLWKEQSLVVLNIVITIIYVIGLIFN
jgi:hypothetical protein